MLHLYKPLRTNALLLLCCFVSSLKLYKVIEQDKNGCTAKIDTDEGEKWLDLMKLNTKRMNTPESDNRTGSYSWSICELSAGCMNELAYFLLNSTKKCDNLGNIARFEVKNDDDSDGTLLLHISNYTDIHRQSSINIICDWEKEHLLECADDLGCSGTARTNKFQLSSKHVCLGSKPVPSAKSSTLSTGIQVLIVGSVIFATYFVIGYINGAIKGRKGLNRLPHSDFWLELPYLVKDGAFFLIRGCRPIGVRYSRLKEERITPEPVDL